jgi:hypothetical protein
MVFVKKELNDLKFKASKIFFLVLVVSVKTKSKLVKLNLHLK